MMAPVLVVGNTDLMKVSAALLGTEGDVASRMGEATPVADGARVAEGRASSSANRKVQSQHMKTAQNSKPGKRYDEATAPLGCTALYLGRLLEGPGGEKGCWEEEGSGADGMGGPGSHVLFLAGRCMLIANNLLFVALCACDRVEHGDEERARTARCPRHGDARAASARVGSEADEHATRRGSLRSRDRRAEKRA